MRIVGVDQRNFEAWVGLSRKLYPYLSYQEMWEECEAFLKNGEEVGFLYQLDGEYVAFMNLSIKHDYVNGTETSPVVFLEGIYVEEGYRKRGIARELVQFAVQYTLNQGLKELASDSLIDNEVGQAFHEAVGFIEQERVICYSMKVDASEGGR